LQKEKPIKKMNKTYNIYCVESCHLENDGKRFMVLGAVCCPEASCFDFYLKTCNEQ